MNAIEILWITPKWPLPQEDGARVATCELLGELCALGATVDLLAITGPDESIDSDAAKKELGIRDTFVVTRPARSKYLSWLFSNRKTPLTFAPYGESGVRERVQELLGRNRWQWVVFDGLHGAFSLSHKGLWRRPPLTAKFVYRAHNIESHIWTRLADTQPNPIVKLLLRHQAKQVERFERSLLRACDFTAPVSQTDLQILLQLEPSNSYHWIPIGQKFTQPPAPPSDAEHLGLLFLGRLDWPPNADGLSWFLREVWPSAHSQRPDLILRVAGSGNPPRHLRRYLSTYAVEYLGRVPDTNPLYAQSAFCLVPVFYGSGTRVKAIESARMGRACISTALGVEGIPLQTGRDYLNAESAEQWIEALTRLTHLTAETMGKNAFKALQPLFDSRKVAANFFSLLSRPRA